MELTVQDHTWAFTALKIRKFRSISLTEVGFGGILTTDNKCDAS